MVKSKLLPHLYFLVPLWLLLLVLYIKTSSPSILYIDSGTIITAAYTLGIPNPPGFPFYLLIANLFSKLPFSSLIFRLEFLSILSAIGVVTLVYFAIERLILTNFFFIIEPKDDKRLFSKFIPAFKKKKAVNLSIISARICALASSLILAFSYEFWSQTLNTESYIFTNFMLMILLVLLLTVSKKSHNIPKRALIGAAVLGFATGANPTIVQVVPALLVGLFFYRKFLSVKTIVFILVLAAAGNILVYSYLPIRAAAYPFLNWGNPQTWDLFWGHIRGEGLNIYDPRTNSINGFTGSPEIFMQSMGRYLFLLTLQFTPVFIPFLLAGACYICMKNKYLFATLLTIPVTNMIFGAIYLSGNQESWFIASYVIFAIFIGASFAFILEIILSYQSKWKYAPYFLLVLPCIPLIYWFPKLDRANHIVTNEYIDNLYNKLPKNTVLIGTGDFFNSASLYQHEVLKKRPDVFPIVSNMWYILPWYRDNLRHQNADIMPKDLDKMIKKTRYSEYREVMNWYIEYLINKGYPVYVTPMVFRESVLAGTDAGKLVLDKDRLKQVEAGLAYRILGAKDLLQPDPNTVNYTFKDPEFFKKRPYYLERNYNGAYNTLMTEYATSYTDMADYLYGISRQKDPFGGPDVKRQKELFEQANDLVKKAYALAPFSPEILNRLAITSAMNNDLKSAVSFFQQAEGYAPNDTSIMLNLANSLIATNQMEEARKKLQQIISIAQDPETKGQAQNLMAKINLDQIELTTAEWKEYKSFQEYRVKYPPDWSIRTGAVAVIASPDKLFSVALYGGVLGAQEKKEAWIARDPLVFSGKLENKGLAQIPGFDATAAMWNEPDGKKALEFVLTVEKHILHVKVKPSDSPYMKNLDQILSTIKFLR